MGISGISGFYGYGDSVRIPKVLPRDAMHPRNKPRICVRPSCLCLRLCLSAWSVCLSQVRVLLKRQNVGSRQQKHTIAQGV